MAFCPPIPEYPEIEKSKPRIISTACWRGYVGAWEFKDAKFYPVDDV